MLIVKNEVDLKTSNRPVKYEILIKQCLHLNLSKNGNYITEQSFIRGSSAQKFSPLTSYITVLDRKGTSFVYHLLTNGTPFTN